MTMRRRHGDVHDVMRMLESHLPEMAGILEHRRPNGSMGDEARMTPDGRRIKECVAVMLVEEADGSETVLIVGDASSEHLALKGVLHDGIYAFAHKGEPGFTAPPAPAT